nr:thioether cross-link-forming SCIFF peptide maturase [Maliibacterium massiliense]
MVHSFKACGVYVALDVDSGSVFQIDPLAHEVIQLYEGHTYQEVFDLLSPQWGRQAVKRAYGEIDELVRQGLLFTHLDVEELVRRHDDAGVIKAMCLNVSHDCNLRCAYCFASTGSFGGRRAIMSPEVGCRALDFLIAHSGKRKHLEVDFFGGEPMLAMDTVRAVVDYGRGLEKETGKSIAFTITTNCAQISDEDIAYFNREMHNVVLSIDGRRKVHDKMRRTAAGEGSFDIVSKNALRVARARGDREYFARGTFTRGNLDFARDALALNDMGFDKVSIEPVVAPANMPYALLEEHLPRIEQEYEVLALQYRARRLAGKPFVFFHFMLDLEGGPCLPKRLKGCGAGNEYVCVTPDAGIYPCHQFAGEADYKMGDVLQGTLDESMRARFRANHVLSKPACRDCWAKYFCSGGCVANAVHYNGDMSKPYEMSCAMERKRLECALALHVLGDEPDPS